MATQLTQQQTVLDPASQAYREALLKLAQAKGNQAFILPEYTFAGLDPLQTKAYNLADSGIGAYETALSQAGTLYGDAGTRYGETTGAYDPTSVTDYMNPYQSQVIQNAMDEMQRRSDIAKQGTASDAVRSGAFGGSRFGVQRAEESRNLAQAQNQKMAELMAAGYAQAQAASMAGYENQQARKQAAASGIASLGGQMSSLAGQTQALGQGETSYLESMGASREARDQAQKDATRLLPIQQYQSDFARIGQLSDIFNTTPSGQTTLGVQYAAGPTTSSQIIGNTLGTYGALNQANKPTTNIYTGYGNT
jgi:hypothetical protein